MTTIMMVTFLFAFFAVFLVTLGAFVGGETGAGVPDIVNLNI